MKNNLKQLLKQETEQVNVSLSQKVLDTPLETKKPENGNVIFTTTTSEPKKSYLKMAFSSLCMVLMSMVAFLGIFSITNQKASALTTYIIEINPSICITADEDNTIVSAYSLNNDGDEIISHSFFENIKNLKLDDCLKNIINLSIEKGYISHAEIRNIKLIVTNNKESYAHNKGAHAKQVFDEELKSHGFENFSIQNQFLPVNEFKNRMGFDVQSNDLDEMRYNIINHNRFFNPEFNAHFFMPMF